jgi:D-3-phosphoglycerate dehydrogenase
LPAAEVLVAQNKGFPYRIIDAAALRRAKRLRLIQHHGASYDASDTAAAAQLGGPVAVTTGENQVSVAETAFHIMISLAKKAREARASVEAGVMGRVLCTELAAKTLCVVGVGRIGKAFARMARGFGMNVIGVRRSAQTDDVVQAGFSRVCARRSGCSRNRGEGV